MNFVCTVGAFILAIGIFFFLYDIFRTLRKGPPAGNDPWDGRTLEWTLPSPPPPYNFARTPIVHSRDALWADKHGKKSVKLGSVEPSPGGIHMPSNSWFPLVASVGFLVLGVSMALKQAGVPYCGYIAVSGLLITFVGIYLWALEGPGGYHLHPEEES